MRSREISIWTDERWYNAVSHHLGEETVESRLSNIFSELCKELPSAEYDRINSEIAEEKQRDREEYEANRKLAVFHIKENGSEVRFSVDNRVELLDATRMLRAYLQSESKFEDGFAGRFRHREPLTPEQFQAYAAERMENTGRVTGAYAVDLDNGIFSALNIMDGWQSYKTKDISAAAYHAFRKHGEQDDTRWRILLDRLDGKELSPEEFNRLRTIRAVGDEPRYLSGSRRLTQEDISFVDEIVQEGRLLNFYMEVIFDPDKVFGTNVATDENDDWINVYADYDMEAGRLCDDLYVYLVQGDGNEQDYKYRLTDEEKSYLLPKMEEHCQHQLGMSLGDCRQQYCTEQNEEPGLGGMSM